MDPKLLNKDGYLNCIEDWSPDIAKTLALEEGITLTDNHWVIFKALQSFYTKYEHAPAMRPLVSIVKKALPETNVTTLFLHQLFPEHPAKQAARLAGLPKPKHCL